MLSLKQAKLDVVTFQIQNTELTKLNHALQEQLKEEKKINEKWLTSLKKVSQYISEQIPHQKKKVLGGELLIESLSKININENAFIFASMEYDQEMVPKTKDWAERLNLDRKLPNFNTERILVPKNQAGASLRSEVMPLNFQPYSPKERPCLGSLRLLHIDLFGLVSPVSINHEKYTLVIVDEYSRERIPDISYFHMFGCLVFIHNQKDHLGKFDAKVDDGYFLRYLSILKYFKVYKTRRQQIEETYHVIFDESIEAIREGMLTRSMAAKLTAASTSKCLFADFLSEIEPKKVSKALKHPRWIDAINKKDKHGTTIKNKARLVAQVYSQEEGTDYDETFAPVATMEAIRISLAFPHPHGFKSSEFHDYVCKLNKALYGLKQAPRAWYQSNPKESHLIAVKRMLRYLKGTLTLGLYYPKCLGFNLKGYSGSDYASCKKKNFREFWGTGVSFDPFPSTDEPEKRPLKDSVSLPPLVAKPMKGKSQTVTSTSPKSQGLKASGALSKKRKRPSTGFPSTLDEGTRKSQPLLESTATHLKDSEGKKQPFDRDITFMTLDKGIAKTTLRPEGSREDKDLRESKEDILGAGEEMDDNPQSAETQDNSSPPQEDKHTSSIAPILKHPILILQVIKSSRTSMSSFEKSSSTINDLYTSLKVITQLFKDITNSVKDDPATTKKIKEAFETLAKISTQTTKILSSVRSFDFSTLQSTVKNIQDHAFEQEEASVAWMKSSTNMA
nr:retrovirus-related Pol polyprotein from transposon TNT 1-94 [Tanacetum cinerariifolium]